MLPLVKLVVFVEPKPFLLDENLDSVSWRWPEGVVEGVGETCLYGGFRGWLSRTGAWGESFSSFLLTS